ncbi:hypothetical protein [Corynebacterium stationis]|uniref:hypothetical protein n=1 Tax=Corynebacterium stationis TaxID=1705 RepID=UPI000B0F75C7|nr:hypothetical protein [Corynebacterium stationis]
MKIKRIVPITTVSNREELEQTLQQHVEVLGMEVVMDHGWIATLADAHGHQLSIMMKDSTAPGNPDTSVFVDDVHHVMPVHAPWVWTLSTRSPMKTGVRPGSSTATPLAL